MEAVSTFFKRKDVVISAHRYGIDAKYPTLPDRGNTAIGGSSMGGLMSLYAITAYNCL